jgi:hypothetical protein
MRVYLRGPGALKAEQRPKKDEEEKRLSEFL